MESYHANREVYDALITLADFTGVTENQIVSSISFLDDKMFQKFKLAIEEVNSFNSLPLKKRCEKMGYKYSEKPDGVQEISTEF